MSSEWRKRYPGFVIYVNFAVIYPAISCIDGSRNFFTADKYCISGYFGFSRVKFFVLSGYLKADWFFILDIKAVFCILKAELNSAVYIGPNALTFMP